MTTTHSDLETDHNGASARSETADASMHAGGTTATSRTASMDTLRPHLSAPTPLERMEASLEPLALRRLLGHFATGVTVLTCRSSSGADIGATISALTSVSLNPPLLLVCVQLRTKVCHCLTEAVEFAVNVLASDQEALARRFAQPCDERFAGVAVKRGKTGAALLHGALAHFECRIVSTQHAGDHAIFIGEIIGGSGQLGHPLLHFRGSLTNLPAVDRLVLGERLLENAD